MRESDDDHNSAEYHVIPQLSHTSKETALLRMPALTATPLCNLQIEYSFRWLQTPLEKKLWEKKGYRPLAAVNVINIAVITSEWQVLLPLQTAASVCRPWCTTTASNSSITPSAKSTLR